MCCCGWRITRCSWARSLYSPLLPRQWSQRRAEIGTAWPRIRTQLRPRQAANLPRIRGMAVSLTLIIGNKNYSSWSMRPWVLLRGSGLPFAERHLKFHTAEWSDHIGRLSPSGMVPVLWEGEPGSGFATWDTLAIAERLHELFPKAAVWPSDGPARARGRAR